MRNTPELNYILNQLISDHIFTNTFSFKIKYNVLFPSNLIFQTHTSQIYQLICWFYFAFLRSLPVCMYSYVSIIIMFGWEWNSDTKFNDFDLHFANTAEEAVRQEHIPNLNLFCIGTNNVGIGMCTGGPQIPGVSPPWRLHFLWWRGKCLDLRYGTYFMSPYRHLESSGGCLIFKTFLHSWYIVLLAEIFIRKNSGIRTFS